VCFIFDPIRGIGAFARALASCLDRAEGGKFFSCQ
jgi:hypothetical protein